MDGKLERRTAEICRAEGSQRWLLACSASTAAMMASLGTPALAQTTTPPQAQNTGIAEIVVTAQKRSQNIQDVPIAVTALTPATLQVNRVTSVNDLTGLSPGLLSRQNAGSNASPSFSMRGVFASASSPAQDRQISIYLDGVYVGGTRGSIFDLPDLERIEVLRGPQGTLFGRNATAGAISVVTRDPDGKFSARQEFTAGNYAQFRTRTTISTPEFGPFSAYFTYVHDQRHGDVRNLGAGTPFDRTSPFYNLGVQDSPKYLGGHDNNNYFAALKFEPNDTLRMVYKFDRSDGDFTPEARTTQVINSSSLVGGLLSGILAAQSPGGGAFGPTVLDPQNKRPDATNNAWNQTGFVKSYGHNLTTTLQLTDHLSFKNITAYRHSVEYGPASILGLDGLVYTAAAKAFYTAPRAFLGGASYANIFDPSRQGNEAVGTYFGGYEGNNFGRGDQFSSETQLNYNSRLLTLTAGALYYHSYELDGGVPGSQPNFGFQPIPSQIPLGSVQNSTSKAESLAAYLQAELHVTSKIELVAGGRVTKDKKDTNFITGGTFTGTPSSGTITGTTSFPNTFKKTKPSFSIGANYKPDRDVLLYAKYSTAFLSGGAAGPVTFQPETVKSEELGLKSEFFNHRLRANLSLYHAVYHHSQSAQSGSNVGLPAISIVVIDNGTLKDKGAEFELSAEPLEGLTLGGSISYDDHKLTNPNPLAAQGRPYSLVGVPKWTASANAQYQTQPIFDDAYLFFRFDANYTGKYRAIPFTDLATALPAFLPYAVTPSRWILNGRVALRQMKIGRADAEVAVWAKNITDNKDPLYTLAFSNFQVDSSYQPARTFGVDLIINFK